MKDIINRIHQGDAIKVLKTFPDNFINTCVTSPPYWGLRDYGVDGQLGLEKTPEEYIEKMVLIFREVKRVLRDDGTLWLNMGDSYCGSWGNYGPTSFGGQREKHTERFTRGAYDNHKSWRPPTSNKLNGLKPKDLVGMPWRIAFALQADGWYLRQDIIWHKPNPMPESVNDRPTTAHEYIFLLSKSKRYYYDAEAIKEPVTGNAHARGDGVNPKAKYAWNRAIDGSVSDCRKGKGEEIRKIKQNESFSAAVSGLVNKRNKRSVWTVPTHPYPEAHFATFPPDLIKPCILAGCPEGGIVLDPFVGAGTTALVAKEHSCNYVGIDLNPEYIKLSNDMLSQEVLI